MAKLIIVDSANQITSYEAPHTRRGFTIEAVIGAWLDSIKGKRSGSANTQKDYTAIITAFRQYLAGYDLDLLPAEHIVADEDASEDWLVTIADMAQIFVKTRAATSHFTGDVSKNTQRQRLAALSSFYDYATGRRHLTLSNPISMIDRPSVEAYSGAKALLQEQVIARLSAIDGDNPEDLRDLALLSVLLFTGRRAREVAGVRREHITVLPNKQIQIHFAQGKGGKQFIDILSPEVSAILARWLNYWYRGRFHRQTKDAAIWTDVEHISRAAEPLGYYGIRGIVIKRLGTSKVHTTRHTFAYLMKLIGAGLSDIQALLGHENAATTSRYLEAVAPEENPFSGKLTESLGLQRKRKA